MKGRHNISRITVFSICVILLLSLADFQEQEPFGLHVGSDGKRVLLGESDVELGGFQDPESLSESIRSHLDNGPCVPIAIVLPGLSLRRFDPMDACRRPPDETGPGSPSVQRI